MTDLNQDAQGNEAGTAFPPVFWRRLDLPGCESARLSRLETGWRLAGCAVFAFPQGPCRLDYAIDCAPDWRTQSARITGWVGARAVDIAIRAGADQHWQMNGAHVTAVDGCLDLDLNFSPVTNLLPVRRLALRPGGSAPVVAAWLRFPGFTLEPLPQAYTRTGERSYRYESAGGAFTADLTVNDQGMVIDYPPIWAAA